MGSRENRIEVFTKPSRIETSAKEVGERLEARKRQDQTGSLEKY